METNKDQLETLNEIKGLMQRSAKFVSLSGMSGIAAGTVALTGSAIISYNLHIGFFEQLTTSMINSMVKLPNNVIFIFAMLFAVLLLALLLVIYFSSRNAKSKRIIFWDSIAKTVFKNLFLFLITGGIFCLILFHYGIYFLIVPAMLIFYGLALINVSKFTFNEITQLGIIEICLGIFASFIIVYPLLIWTVGFGILHLIYGIYVYLKYERSLH